MSTTENTPIVLETRAYLDQTLAGFPYAVDVTDRLQSAFGSEVNGHCLAQVLAGKLVEQARRRGVSPISFINHLTNYSDGDEWAAQINGVLIQRNGNPGLPEPHT